MKYMQYMEFVAPKEMLTFLEKKAEINEVTSLQEAGFFDLLGELSKEGWRPIWQSMNFPRVMLEREVEEEEVEK